jgi:DNA mismatch endonuclease (patch repair protein)
MTDVHTREQRSKNMSRVRSRDTKPELTVRSMLHRMGYRFRLHLKTLPGKPDIVLPKYRAIIFVNGCFWHKHECHLFKWPSTRTGFWKRKIEGNYRKDKESTLALEKLGWRVCVIWECSLKGRFRNHETLLIQLGRWLQSKKRRLEIRGL